MKTYYTEYPKGQFQAASDEEALKNNALVIYREDENSSSKHFVLKAPKCRLCDCENTIQLPSGKIVGMYDEFMFISQVEYPARYTVTDMDTDPMVRITDFDQMEEYLRLAWSKGLI